jgi:hypothetical protein
MHGDSIASLHTDLYREIPRIGCPQNYQKLWRTNGFGPRSELKTLLPQQITGLGGNSAAESRDERI